MDDRRWTILQHVVFPIVPGVLPAVRIAARHERRHFSAAAIARMQVADWVVDMPWQHGLRMRVGGEDAPWQVRPAGRLHIYAPETVFWEDPRGMPGGVLRGVYLIFRDPAALLARLTGRSGFAAVDDHEGRLRRILAAPFTDPGVPSFWRCQAALAGLLDELAAAAPAGGGLYRVGGAMAEPGLASRVDAELREHLDRPLSLAEVARRLGLGVSSLCHRFRAEAGEPVMARWRRLRVERALALMQRGIRLDEVAGMCGFCDRFHLSRTVRQVTGRSPASWRKAP